MDADSASENLKVIRTLMERSAIYRRALAPIMTFLGVLGLAASAAGFILRIDSASTFAAFWMAVALAGIAGSYLLARRQAFKDREPFWSPPTRRVTLALLPALFAGAVTGIALAVTLSGAMEKTFAWLAPVAWILFYGCALHAAGFFTPRGLGLLGLIFIMGACAITLSSLAVGSQLPIAGSHVIMGVFFGGLQLAYGIYLRMTEKPARRP